MKTKHFFKRNGSTILTCIGAVGVVATAVTAVKATPKVTILLEKERKLKGEELTKIEVIKVAGPHYIPSILIGVGTLTCIFGSNVLNKRQQASLASAYALLDTSFKEYKKKVIDLYNEEADIEIRNEIAKDKYEENDIEVDDNKMLFYEEYSGRYFESTSKEVIQAEYNLNRELTNHGGVYLNKFYKFLDIAPTDYGNEYGWSLGVLESHYWANWIEFDHEKVIMADGLECTIIRFRYEPVIDFAYY